MTNYTTAQLCDEFNVTPRALRFYEQLELLSPVRLRPKGERSFSRRDYTRLLLIQRGKRFGLTLQQIRTILDLYDAPNGRVKQLSMVLPLLQSQLTAMQDEQVRLEESIEELTSICGTIQTKLDEQAKR